MLALIGVMLLLFILTLFPFENDSAYDEYCRYECWSRRKPCCIR